MHNKLLSHTEEEHVLHVIPKIVYPLIARIFHRNIRRIVAIYYHKVRLIWPQMPRTTLTTWYGK